MAGRGAPFQETLVPPKGVVTRRSTDVTAINDAAVAAAMHFIRQYACDGINVDDVVEVTGVSRSVLQRRFRKLIGRSIHDAILRIRLDRVKALLSETDLPLTDVADRAGFNHSEYLSKVFKQQTGQTVTEYRKAGMRGA
jgi:LacI family transcriptional regulator